MLEQMNDIDDKYDLYGVLVHAGPTAAYGHYYSYVKNKDNQWIRLNDEVCSLVSVVVCSMDMGAHADVTPSGSYTSSVRSMISLISVFFEVCVSLLLLLLKLLLLEAVVVLAVLVVVGSTR